MRKIFRNIKILNNGKVPLFNIFLPIFAPYKDILKFIPVIG